MAIKGKKVAVYLVKGLIFFLPLFFLPLPNSFELNKQIILWLVPSLAFWFFGWENIWSRRLVWQKTLLDVPILLFLFVLGISSIFSLDSFSSFFGYWDNYSYAYLGFFSLGILYFLVVNLSARGKLNIFSLLKICMLAYLFGFIFYIFSVFFLNSAFNVFSEGIFGPAIAAACTAGFLINLLINFSIAKIKLESFWRWIFLLVLAISLFLLLFFNLKGLWLGLIISLLINLILLSFSCLSFDRQSKKKLMALFGIIIFLAFLNIDFGHFFSAKADTKTSRLDYRTSTQIIAQNLKNKLFFGSGLGSFAYAFSQYRPSSFNYSTDWQLRFSKSYSYILDLFNDTGLAGIITYFLLVTLLFVVSFLLIKRAKAVKSSSSKSQALALVMALSGAIFFLLFVQFIYPANTVLLFLFWFFIACLVALWRNLLEDGKNKFIFSKNFLFLASWKWKIGVLITFFLFSFCFALAVYEIKIWSADIIFSQEKNEVNLKKAALLSPQEYYYHLALAKFYLRQAKQDLDAASPQMEENIKKSLKWAHSALDLAPNSVVAWETAAIVYREIMPFVKDSEKWAIKSFVSAFELEPSNPVLASEIGKVYLQTGNTAKAIEYLKKSLDLKNDYYDAQFNLARVYAAENNYRASEEILQELVVKSPNSYVYYELGRIHYNLGNIKLAQSEFTRAIELDPNNANALYSLALVEEGIGNNKKAISLFKKLLSLEPDNIKIKRMLEKLENK